MILVESEKCPKRQKCFFFYQKLLKFKNPSSFLIFFVLVFHYPLVLSQKFKDCLQIFNRLLGNGR